MLVAAALVRHGDRDEVVAVVDISRRQRWMDVSRRESWRIIAWARDFGQARELGEYYGSYRALRGRKLWGWGIVLIMLAILAGVPVAAAFPRGARVVALCVAGVVFALGVVLVKKAPREKVDWVFWYSGGVAQFVDGEPTPRVVHWQRLDHVVRWFSQRNEGDPYPVGVSVTGTDGTEIKVNGWNLGFPGLDWGISDLVAGVRLPAAIEQCDRGMPVHFGDLAVSQDGIAWSGGEHAPWLDMRSLRLAPHEIRIPGRPEPVSLIGVPNTCVAIPLIQELAARHGIDVQLKGSLATHAAGPDQQRTKPSWHAVLSEAEVGEVLGWPMHAIDHAFPKRWASFQGGGVNVTLKLRRAVTLDRLLPRLLGRAVPGIGNNAWLLHKSQDALIARVGAKTMMVSVTNLPPSARAATLIQLARLVAARLASAAR